MSGQAFRGADLGNLGLVLSGCQHTLLVAQVLLNLLSLQFEGALVCFQGVLFAFLLQPFLLFEGDFVFSSLFLFKSLQDRDSLLKLLNEESGLGQRFLGELTSLVWRNDLRRLDRAVRLDRAEARLTVGAKILPALVQHCVGSFVWIVLGRLNTRKAWVCDGFERAVRLGTGLRSCVIEGLVGHGVLGVDEFPAAAERLLRPGRLKGIQFARWCVH